jgi:hypothetical protein
MIPGRPVRMRRPHSTFKFANELHRALAAARDVVADVKHAPRARCRREQRVKCRDAPRVRRRNVETHADVIQPGLADPANARLQRLQRGQQQVTLFARFASANRYVRVAVLPLASITAIPARARRPKQRIHRGTLVISRGSAPQVQIHQSSPAAARGSAR